MVIYSGCDNGVDRDELSELFSHNRKTRLFNRSGFEFQNIDQSVITILNVVFEVRYFFA